VTVRGCARRKAQPGRPARSVAALALASVLLATGCASLAPLPRDPGAEALSGRLAIRIDPAGTEAARSFSSAFDLRGDARAGVLGLATPLGSLLAQARWSPSEVTLTTPQGTRAFADLGSLTREVLGESVPVEAWFDWLRGRPWPEAPSTPVGAAGFEQLGWSVDLTRTAEGQVLAVRDRPLPKVTVRIQLDAG
jgi:outer membrane lipoprotein LolB